MRPNALEGLTISYAGMRRAPCPAPLPVGRMASGFPRAHRHTLSLPGGVPIRKGGAQLTCTSMARGDIMRKKHIVGTITGMFDDTLDGIAARLVRRRKFGYTVELLESKAPFQKGDMMHLSPAEFVMPPDHTGDMPLRTESNCSSESNGTR